MRKNRFLALIMIALVMLMGLTSCGGDRSKNNTVWTDAIFEEVENNESTTIKYKYQIVNQTIYNIENVTFTVELFNGDESVKVIEDKSLEPLTLEHNENRIITGEFNKDCEFDSIKVIGVKYSSKSFMDTYLAYVIIIPIAAILFSAFVAFILYRGRNDKGTGATKPSVIGVLAILILLSMTQSIGIVPVLFLLGAAGVVVLTAFITSAILKKKYPEAAKVEVLDSEEATDVIDAEVVEALDHSDNANDDTDSKEEK